MADVKVVSELNGTVWKILVRAGDRVAAGDTLILLESMKMEIPVAAEDAGVVKQLLVSEEQAVSEGDLLAILER
jgi:acetyl-CoA carboxylase biotin carboxyl carrier protein